MTKLTRKDLYSLEQYSEMRSDFRKKIIAHKENRRLELGENVLLMFEDRLVMQYQIQEMLKLKRYLKQMPSKKSSKPITR